MHPDATMDTEERTEIKKLTDALRGQVSYIAGSANGEINMGTGNIYEVYIYISCPCRASARILFR